MLSHESLGPNASVGPATGRPYLPTQWCVQDATQMRRSSRRNNLKCIRLEDGVTVAEDASNRYGSILIVSDGLIIAGTDISNWSFVRCDPERLQGTAAQQRPVSKAHCATSIIIDGRLFMRAKRRVYCWDLRMVDAE